MRRLRDARVSTAQLIAVALASAAVTAIVVVAGVQESRPERAVIAALRTREVVTAAAPATTTAAGPAAASGSKPSVAAIGAPSSSSGGGATASASSSAASTPTTAASSAAPAPSPSQATTTTSTTAASSSPKSPVKHVFVISVQAPSYPAAFGSKSVAHYLDRTLRPQGELLSGYHTLDAASPLPDLVALISGQGPNRDTSAGCSTYAEFPATATPSHGILNASGCIYPNAVLTLGDELDGADLPWRGYIQGMTSPCEHPDTGAADQTLDTASYMTDRNPFVYFHSLLDLGDCQTDDVPYSRLAPALRSAAKTPRFVFISPDVCDAGAGSCPAGQPSGVAAVDAFLRKAVPPILRSPAYRASGALMILFSAAPGSVSTTGTTTTGTTTTSTGTTTTSTTPTTPATSTSTTSTTPTATAGTTTAASGTTTAASGTTTTTGATTGATTSGPARTGALVLSPYVRAGTTDRSALTPYSVLRSLEALYGVTALGHSKTAASFDSRVFSTTRR